MSRFWVLSVKDEGHSMIILAKIPSRLVSFVLWDNKMNIIMWAVAAYQFDWLGQNVSS